MIVVPALSAANMALAQDIGHVDTYAIQRGYKIAAACADSVTEAQNDCEHRAAKLLLNSKPPASMTSSDFGLLLGFDYYLWLDDATGEEVYKNARAASDNQRAYFQQLATLYGEKAVLDYDNMQRWNKFVFVPFSDLCVITASNCTKVREMLQRWRGRGRN